MNRLLPCWKEVIAVATFGVATAFAGAPDGMVLVPAGTYQPLFKNEPKVEVEPFYLDVYPVTNDEFLEFVRANPEWRRSNVKRLFADEHYLRYWAGDLDLGPDSEKIKNSPVTRVSWFAARAYCAWKEKRLPSLAEWEYVAAASETQPRGDAETNYLQRILRWYEKPTPATLPPVGSTFKNYFGVYDMHGLVWEWIADFNTALVTGESRADTGLDRSMFCGTGSIGASNFRDYAAFMRYALRSSLKADYTLQNLGFRCAKDVEVEKTRSCCKKIEAAPAVVSDKSIFQFASLWQNQRDEELKLNSLGGKVSVVAMFYSSCLYVCPRIVADMKAIDARLNPEEREKVQFVLVSFDVDRDQPDVLNPFAQKMDIQDWTLLHGNEDGVRELAAVLNVRYRKEAGGHFAHSSIINVIDPNGVVVHQQEGFGADLEQTMDELHKQVNAKEP